MRLRTRDLLQCRPCQHQISLTAGTIFDSSKLALPSSIDSPLRELARNPSLLAACGFDPLPLQRMPTARVVVDPEAGMTRIETPVAEEPQWALPASWKVSRFLANVIQRH